MLVAQLSMDECTGYGQKKKGKKIHQTRSGAAAEVLQGAHGSGRKSWKAATETKALCWGCLCAKLERRGRTQTWIQGEGDSSLCCGQRPAPKGLQLRNGLMKMALRGCLAGNKAQGGLEGRGPFLTTQASWTLASSTPGPWVGDLKASRGGDS